MSSPSPFEYSKHELVALVNEVARRILDSIEQEAQPCTFVSEPAVDCGQDLRKAKLEAIKLRDTARPSGPGRPLRDVIDQLLSASSHGMIETHPGDVSYFNGGGLPLAAIGALAGDLLNRFVGMWPCAPGVAEIEGAVVHWCACDVVGFNSQSASGFIASGGSEAALAAIIAARRHKFGDTGDFTRATMYASDQTHGSVRKGAVLAGIPLANVRIVRPSRASDTIDEEKSLVQMTLDPAALDIAIADDIGNGKEPFLVVATAGSTATGAVDDLRAIARVAHKHGLWLHVDGAYGAFFALTQRGRALLSGMELADSVSMDFHKSLFMPRAIAALVVRDGELLHSAFSVETHRAPSSSLYLPEGLADEELSFCDISPELSRPNRGIQVWLPLVLLGVDAFRSALDEKLDIAVWLRSQLASIPGIQLEPCEAHASPLTVITFRRAGFSTTKEANEATQTLIERVLSYRRIYITGATVRGIRLARLCVLNFRTHKDHVQMLVEDVRRAAIV